MRDLKERVQQFQRLELPGQPWIMHMGTSISHLVNDLWREVQKLEAENGRLYGSLEEALRTEAELKPHYQAIEAQLHGVRAENERIRRAAEAVTHYLQWYVEEERIVEVDPEPLQKLKQALVGEGVRSE